MTMEENESRLRVVLAVDYQQHYTILSFPSLDASEREVDWVMECLEDKDNKFPFAPGVYRATIVVVSFQSDTALGPEWDSSVSFADVERLWCFEQSPDSRLIAAIKERFGAEHSPEWEKSGWKKMGVRLPVPPVLLSQERIAWVLWGIQKELDRQAERGKPVRLRYWKVCLPPLPTPDWEGGHSNGRLAGIVERVEP